jgi:succinyl-CoA synthetase beta subunit
LTFSPSDAKNLASQMLGQKLVTKQTGPAGKICNAVYICEKKYIRREFYLAILMDRGTQGPMIVGSSQGGVDIETVAAESPEAILTLPVSIIDGLSREAALDFAKRLEFAPQCREEAADTIMKLYQIFTERDATQIEINPLAESSDHKVLAMDAKFGFDDNAEFRQEEVFSWRDRSQENADEVKAAEFGLNFIKLDVSSFFVQQTDKRDQLDVLSTVLVLPWPLWISSNLTVVNPPTSLVTPLLL